MNYLSIQLQVIPTLRKQSLSFHIYINLSQIREEYHPINSGGSLHTSFCDTRLSYILSYVCVVPYRERGKGETYEHLAFL